MTFFYWLIKQFSRKDLESRSCVICGLSIEYLKGMRNVSNGDVVHYRCLSFYMTDMDRDDD